MNLKQKITHNLLNIPGWRTKRHIVVFESDDWGAIRMPSKVVYDKLLSKGYRVDLNKYEKNDSLATEKDLTELFNILSKYTDINGNHPMITANCAVANPDFEKIKESDFQMESHNQRQILILHSGLQAQNNAYHLYHHS